VLASNPYRININNVISIKTPDNASIVILALAVWAGINCGKKERKKRVSFGFNTFKAIPLQTIPRALAVLSDVENVVAPAYFHVLIARYRR